MAAQNTNGTGPQPHELHLRDVWNLVVRNWLVLALSLALVIAAVAAYNRVAVPVYEARTSIRIEEERSNVPVLDVLSEISTGSEVETEMEVLRSRSLAEDVVDSLALQVRVAEPRGAARQVLLDNVHVERWAPAGEYRLARDASGFQVESASGENLGRVTPTTPAALPGLTFVVTPRALDHEEIVVRVKDFAVAVEDLRRRLTVERPNREASLVEVHYESADTQLVHAVPNTLADRFIARRQDIRKTEARSTVRFLEEQIDTIGLQLNLAEEVVTRYRQDEQVVNLEAEASAQVTQLAQLQGTRNELSAERDALQELLEEIQSEAQQTSRLAPSPYRRLIAFHTLLSNPAVSEYLRSLSELERERQVLLERRTPEDPEVEALTTRIRDQETQLRSIATTYLQSLANQVRSYDQTLARFSTELERIPDKEVQLARLERRRQVLEDVNGLLQNRLQEARIAQAVEDPSVRVVDVAVLPSRPLRPKPVVNLVLGGILGLLLGMGIAVMRDYMDDTIHTREDLQRLTGGHSVLGTIPRIKAGDQTPYSEEHQELTGRLETRLVTGRDPRSPVSEAYRSLRTNLTFSNPDNPPQTLVFASALPQDGKSTTAANLAITLAQQGVKTVLVDADLRRGLLYDVFDTDKEPGLSSILAGHATLADAVRIIELGNKVHLHFIPTGPFPPNPAEILGSNRMKTLLDQLEERYEVVILDSAPLTVVTDAAVLGTKADGVILVARASVTQKGALAYAVEQLENVRAPILGSVLNDVDYRRDSRYSSSYSRYGYYYHYYYGDDGSRKKSREKKGKGKGRKAAKV